MEQMETDEPDDEPRPSTSAACRQGKSSEDKPTSSTLNLMPPLPLTKQSGVPTSAVLYNGARYKGTMKFVNETDLDLEIDVKYVDFENGFVSLLMYLSVIPSHQLFLAPPVRYYYEGQIVGKNGYTFHTRKWAADFMDDIDCWSRFIEERYITDQISRCQESEPYGWFIRLKERSEYYTLLGHETSPGFYYTWINPLGCMRGLYFHKFGRNSIDKTFEAQLVKEKSFGVFEFR